jgi:phosphoglycolate phosphatase-like HAD superfamily hydrolase
MCGIWYKGGDMDGASQRRADGVVVVLVDIDGTLLHVHGAGRASFVRALKAVFGWDDDIGYINFSGATDLAVLDRVLRRHDHVAGTGQIDLFFDRLAVELRASIRDAEIAVYPGVRTLLERLSADLQAVVGLVTGNTGRCARIKLEAAGLHGHFVLGAYGHEHADRNAIARLALERARRHANGAQVREVWMVGDTPADVAAARAIGAGSLAVGTGAHTLSDLLRAGADHALADLSDVEAVVRILKSDRTRMES